MALNETRPPAWSERIVEAKALARASAAAPLPDVSRPKRVSIRTTVV